MTKAKASDVDPQNSRTSLKQEAAFFAHLALMFDSGVPLVKAFEVLARTPGDFSGVILSVLAKLESGFGLRGAFEEHRESFSPISLILVATGERSGSLAPCLSMAARWAQRSAQLKARVLNAVTYPAIVVGVNFLLTLAFLIWLVPAFSLIIDLESAGGLTRTVLFASELVRNPYFWMGTVLVLGALSWRTTGLQGRLPRYLVRVPVLGLMVKEIHRARYWMVFSFLHQAGLPVLQSLELAAQASQSDHFIRLYDELEKSILHGEEPSKHFERHRQAYGSMLVAGMSMLAEGQIGSKLCESLNEHFRVEVEAMLDRFHVVLEPILISLVAISTGLLLMGLYLPFGRFLQKLLTDGL